MSRAFVNEDAGADRPDLPELPVSSHPNHVTPRGLADLQARLAARLADLAALKAQGDRLDKLPEAAAERDIRWLEARLKSAILVDSAGHDLSEVAFGLSVTVADEDGLETSYEIVGEDEADAPEAASRRNRLWRAHFWARRSATRWSGSGPQGMFRWKF